MPIDLDELLLGEALVRGRPSPIPTAVLTMELQRGVMGDLASFPALADAAVAVGLAENAGRLVETARSLEVPVIHCSAEFRADRAGSAANTPLHAAVLRRPEHLLEGSASVELIPEIGPAPDDIVIPRHHGVSPFHGSSLDPVLRNLGVQTLIVTGVSINLGVLGLCIEAVNLGYQVVVATDAVCGVPADYAQQVLTESIGLVGTLATSAAIIDALRSAGQAGAGSV